MPGLDGDLRPNDNPRRCRCCGRAYATISVSPCSLMKRTDLTMETTVNKTRVNPRSRSSENARVVVTGLGALTPLAIGVEESWRALCNGVSGIDHVTHFDTTNLRTKIAGRVKKFDIGDFGDRRFEKRND